MIFRSDCGDVNGKADKHPETTSGEKDRPFSTPSRPQNENKVGKLDVSVYKPFGSTRKDSLSRSPSDTSDSSSETVTCQGR